MAIRPILTIPDPILRQTAKPIERVDADLRRLADDMLATMYDAPGIGLAAPQIGVLRRLIVMDPAKDEAPKTPVVMINPEILERSAELRPHEEGCLSIPDYTAEIERPAMTRVAYIDREGKQQEIALEGIWSTLVQHEIDHLNGVLFIDYLSRLKRDMVVRVLSIVLEVAVAAMAMLAAVKGRPYLYGLALTFAIYVLYDLGRFFGWNVEKGILSVLFLVASASALYAVWGLYREGR
jgi:peptide deformylase